jgi:hypothetical protein
MSAPHHLPQRHLNLISDQYSQTSQFGVRPSIADRFSQLLSDIESFLMACTHEEMCSFWNAIANLRQYLQKANNSSEVPHFLNGRKQQRDFCRILEVLADLPYPHLHLSTHVGERASDRRQHHVYPHLVTQR